MIQHVQAQHLDITIDAELRQSQVERHEARERARNPQAVDQPTKPPRPRVVVVKTPAQKSAPKPAASKPAPVPPVPPKPAPPASPALKKVELPPGAMVVSKSELSAIDEAMAFYQAHHPIPKGR